MNKIICDICGTTYPETAECCPICGYTQETAEDIMGEDLLDEAVQTPEAAFGGRKKEIFDFDEVNSEPDEDYDEDEEEYNEEDDEEEEEEASGHNTVLVILLTILIVGLLVAAGFIFIRYFLPNMGGEEEVPAQTMAVISEEVLKATENTIPCETLIISSGMVAELNAEGQHFLLHIKAMPENTTDKIIYTSADESIATVSEDGRITAVSEGQTKIYISCGKSSIECPVIINYVEETVPPTTEATEAAEEPAGTEGTVTDGTEPAEVETAEPAATQAPQQLKEGITLKLKKTDIMLGVYYQYTLVLDCDLEQNEVQWSSEHPHIAKVDENGVVTAVKSGTTAITAKYGDQEVTCMVRCG